MTPQKHPKTRWGLVRNLPDLEAVVTFLRQIGRHHGV